MAAVATSGIFASSSESPSIFNDFCSAYYAKQYNEIREEASLPWVVWSYIIIVVGFIGNAIVIVHAFLIRNRTSVSYFLTYLAWMNMITCYIILPYMVHQLGHFYNGKEFHCKLYSYLIFVSVQISHFTFLAASVHRYRNRDRPNHFVMSRRSKILYITIPTIYSLLINIPIYLIYGDRLVKMERDDCSIKMYRCYYRESYMEVPYSYFLTMQSAIAGFLTVAFLIAVSIHKRRRLSYFKKMDEQLNVHIVPPDDSKDDNPEDSAQNKETNGEDTAGQQDNTATEMNTIKYEEAIVLQDEVKPGKKVKDGKVKKKMSKAGANHDKSTKGEVTGGDDLANRSPAGSPKGTSKRKHSTVAGESIMKHSKSEKVVRGKRIRVSFLDSQSIHLPHGEDASHSLSSVPASQSKGLPDHSPTDRDSGDHQIGDFGVVDAGEIVIAALYLAFIICWAPYWIIHVYLQKTGATVEQVDDEWYLPLLFCRHVSFAYHAIAPILMISIDGSFRRDFVICIGCGPKTDDTEE